MRRVLGAGDAAWLVAGSMIGAGIFYTPGLVSGRLPGMLWPLAAWVLGALLALAGAAVYAELGSRYPRAGGDYRYLTEAFGPAWGFLTGWAAFLLTFTAAVAAMVRVALDYLERALPGLEGSALLRPLWGVPAALVLLTLANTAGARVAGRTTVWLTALPVAGLLALFGAGLALGHAELRWPAAADAPPSLLAFGAAMVPVFFSYTGWNAAGYVAGEIREPQRNLSRGLLVGTAAVAALYLALNVVFLVAVPQAQIAGSVTAGADAARRMWGPGAERVLSALICLAVLGTANVTLMGGSRIYYAMARDGLAPAALGRLGRNGVPTVSLWAAAAWAALLGATTDVGSLVNWATLAILLLSSLTVASLFVLRRNGSAAPFPCPGHPWVPALYLAASLSVAAASAVAEPAASLRGLALLATGWPAYRVFRRRRTGSA